MMTTIFFKNNPGNYGNLEKILVQDKKNLVVVMNSVVNCPDRDIIKYCVPNGTLENLHMLSFYQYQIPNGIKTQYLSTAN